MLTSGFMYLELQVDLTSQVVRITATLKVSGYCLGLFRFWDKFVKNVKYFKP